MVEIKVILDSGLWKYIYRYIFQPPNCTNLDLFFVTSKHFSEDKRLPGQSGQLKIIELVKPTYNRCSRSVMENSCWNQVWILTAACGKNATNIKKIPHKFKIKGQKCQFSEFHLDLHNYRLLFMSWGLKPIGPLQRAWFTGDLTNHNIKSMANKPDRRVD